MKVRPKFGTPEWDEALAQELAGNLNRNVRNEPELKPEPLSPEERARRKAVVAGHNRARADRERLAKQGKG